MDAPPPVKSPQVLVGLARGVTRTDGLSSSPMLQAGGHGRRYHFPTASFQIKQAEMVILRVVQTTTCKEMNLKSKSKKKIEEAFDLSSGNPSWVRVDFILHVDGWTTHRCLLQVGIPFPCSYGERSSYHTKLILQECMRTYLTVHAGWEHVTYVTLTGFHTHHLPEDRE